MSPTVSDLEQQRHLVRLNETVPNTPEHDRLLLVDVENRFGATFHYGLLPMAVVSLDRRFLRVNDALLRVLGRSCEELVGRDLASVSHPDDVIVSQRVVERLEEDSHRPLTIRKRYLRPDGQTVWLDAYIEVVHDTQGRPLYHFCQAVDVTTQVRSEQRQRESEQRWRLTFENAPTGIAVVALDGRFVSVNPAFCVTFGWDQDSMLSLTFDDLRHRDDLAADHLRALDMMTGLAGATTAERRYRHHDGHEIWARTSSALVRDEATGHPRHFIVQVEDVTDRRAERSLLAGILDSLSDGVGVVDETGAFLHHNHAARLLLGTGLDDSDGYETWQQHYGVFETDGRTPFATEKFPLVRALAGESTDQVRMFVRNSGQPDGVTISVSGRPLTTDSGFSGAVAVFHDISAQQAFETRLAEAEQRWRLTVDNAPTGIALSSLDGTFVHVNPALADMLGYSKHDLLRLTFHDITHPDDLDKDLSLLAELMTGERDSYRLQKRYRHAHGHDIWTTISVSMASNEHGEPMNFVSQIEDITQAHRQAERLRLTEERFTIAFDVTPVPMVLSDLTSRPIGRILRVNPAMCELLGYSAEELTDKTFSDLTHPDDLVGDAVMSEKVATSDDRRLTAEGRLVRSDGRSIWVQVDAGVLKDAYGVPTHSVTQLRDVTDRREEQERLTSLALHDPLTGVGNRNLLQQELAAAVARVNSSGSILAVLYADLNGFKAVNDELGHAAGDEVLVTVGERLRHAVRPGDVLVRIGGDEFVVLCESDEGHMNAQQVVRRVRDSMRAPIRLSDERQVSLGISVGMVTASHPGADADDLLARADAAMYRDKVSRFGADPLRPRRRRT